MEFLSGKNRFVPRLFSFAALIYAFRDVFGDTLFSVLENGSDFGRWKPLQCMCGTFLVMILVNDTGSSMSHSEP